VSPVEPFASLQWSSEIVERDAKQALAATTAALVRAALGASPSPTPRMGLGSGSTAFLTLLALAETRDHLPAGLAVVATSYEMEWYATAAGFAVVALDADGVEVAFDGADQVDQSGAMVKGRGGAMHRERAVLAAARSELIVADATKRVATLGGRPLPLDLDPSAIFDTVGAIERVAGAPVRIRTSTGKDGPVLSESGGVLADLEVPDDRTISAELDGLIRGVGGVRDTGYFPPSTKRQFVDS
jgi:ribose 5-phosphate isomerase A